MMQQINRSLEISQQHGFEQNMKRAESALCRFSNATQCLA